MSYTAEELLKMASGFDNVATKALVVSAKKKEKKSLDPKAKVRNRGTVCVPAESAKDKKDHFPINDADQARNALARVHQYSSVPEWYSGSLKGLQALVARKVKAKYPKIDVGGKKEKKSFSLIDELVSFAEDIEKYGQASETMSNNLSLISASLIESARKLSELKQNPGDVPPGNIDAAEMQITNARSQLAQAEREAAKGANAQQLDYYLSDIKKYYGYAQSYVKKADIWDDGLNQIVDTAVNEAKNPPAPQPQQQGEQATTVPAQKAAPQRAAPRVHYPKINSDVQRALNELGFQGKDFKPLNPDSSRGPNTEFALLSFRDSSKWRNLLNIQPNASWEELSNLVMQAKQMKDAGQDKEEQTDFTKGPTMGQPPASGGIVREFPEENQPKPVATEPGF